MSYPQLMELVEQLRKVAGGVEKIDLLDLVTHNDSVQGEARLDQVYELFKENKRDYIAVIDEGVLLGLCSKTDIGFVLGSRFGFAVMGKKPIREFLLGSPVCLIRGHSIRDSLVRVLSRSDKRFYEDVVLADSEGNYLGIIPVPYLVHLQTGLMQEKYRQMEQNITALENSKQQNSQLFENQAIGIVFLDSVGKVRKANQKMTDLLGFDSLDSYQGTVFSIWIIDSDQGRYQRYFEETLNHKEEFFLQSQEFKFVIQNKATRYFRIQFGHIRHYQDPCLFISDVTEQHQMEQALLAREKTAAVESLVCGIAHELNNKLSPIMGLSELLLMDRTKHSNGDSEYENQIRSIYETAKEAGIMIRQLQQLSPPTMTKLERSDLKETLESSLRMVRYSLVQNQISHRLKIPDEKIWILCDLSQMKQIFLNLIMNAIQAMNGKSLKNLSIQVELRSQNVLIHFEDSGEGIPEAIQSKVFEPFFTTKQSFEGVGLGLSICQNLVQNHEGTLTVKSDMGIGTIFTVTLPRFIEVENPSISVSLPEVPLQLRDMDFLEGTKILVVDDEPDICQMMIGAFKRASKVSVLSASSQEKAIDLLKMYRFDWVVSDLRMPFYTGIDLYDWISSNQPYLKDHFLLITGESELSPLSKSIEELQIPIVRKPFSMMKFLDTMQSIKDRVLDHPSNRNKVTSQ